jgi:hypothetical protein
MSTEEIIAPSCQGCSKSIEEGAVVAFGEALFHVNWYISVHHHVSKKKKKDSD